MSQKDVVVIAVIKHPGGREGSLTNTAGHHVYGKLEFRRVSHEQFNALNL